MNDDTVIGFCLGVFFAMALVASLATIDTPMQKDIDRLQASYNKCLSKGAQPYSYDSSDVTCVDGKTYRYID